MVFHVLNPTCPTRAVRFWRVALKKVPILSANAIKHHLGNVGQNKKPHIYIK